MPEAVCHLSSLKTAYFVQNKILKISSFGSVGATLRSLELGGNRIRVFASNKLFAGVAHAAA